ncbi:MAG: nitrate- and nitrite sensing domain-containing protein, partial [Cyclobacteriaceae bacterium]|nr:nitrate- and nitrite sensing domain-containing protein [Cyclobacteriaceae bacterium]
MTIILIPILGVLFYGISNVFQSLEENNQMSQLLRLTNMSIKIGNVVHETQKERGNSAGYIGSNGDDFGEELKGQYLLTDTKISELESFMDDEDLSDFGEDLNNSVDSVLVNLGNIKDIRNKVLSNDISYNATIGYYTDLNALFLQTISQISKVSSNSEITNLSFAYVNFLQSKELAGIERAILSNTFAKGSYAPGAYNRFSRLLSSQETYLDVFISSISKEQAGFYKEKMSNETIAEVENTRAIAISNATVFDAMMWIDVDADYWFEIISAKIDILKEIEDWLSSDILKLATDLQFEAKTSLVGNIIIAILIIAISFALSYVIVQNILKQIGGDPEEVLAIATSISNGDLTLSDTDKGKKASGILGAMRDMSDKLSEIIEATHRAVDSIASASVELSSTSR